MGIKQGKIYSRARVPLGEVVPRNAPFSVQIDLCSLCNMKCEFCFHSDTTAIREAGVKYGSMSFELFQKIIDDMKQAWGGTKEVKKLKLFQIGESLLNPQVSEMIRYAKEANVCECIELTTNGTLLNPELNQKLIDAGLDILNISVNGINSQQYLDKCAYQIDFATFLAHIQQFYEHKKQCRVQIKLSDTGFSPAEVETFYKLFENYCDEIFAENISSVMWQDTNVNEKVEYIDKGLYGQEIQYKHVCPFLFTTLIINSQGAAHICCLDWKMEYPIGNLNEESIAEVWHGERLRNFQRIHLLKNRSQIKLCEHCESPMVSTTDDIDEQVDEILKRL